jgi:uncharacterized RDD family membrane protein YckC
MGCPQCNSNEISSSGICLVCGYQLEADKPAAEPAAEEKENGSFPGMIEMNYSEGAHEPSAKEELPQWRQELSQRLQAIKQKREIVGAAEHPQVEASIALSPAKTQTGGAQAASSARPAEKPPVPKSTLEPPRSPDASPERLVIHRTHTPRQKTLQPLEPEPFSVKPAPKTADPKEIQTLIDNAISMQSAAAPAPVAEITFSAAKQPPRQEGKLILLSRTLSGLIDLILITLCAGAFVIAADFFSGIVVLDAISLICCSVLLLLTYFLYSILFLAASNQTLGMMITDLRVVGNDEKRPSLRRLLGRSLSYLISLFGFGIGLLWSLFDRESQCFHDRISHTHVIRVQDRLSL